MNKDKIWPVGLTVFIVVMVISTLIHVYYTKQKKFDLVTEEYYQKGIKYQEQIDRINRAKNPVNKVTWKFIDAKKSLLLSFPNDNLNSKISGNITFYRPSDASQDKTIPLKVLDNNQQILNLENMSKGYWRIKIFWSRNDQEFYFEDKIVL